MLQELADQSENQGLNMNKSKTKVMMESDTPIYVNKTEIGIERRITAVWTAFAKHRDIFKGNIGTKRQIYNSCVHPTVTYGAETWALITQSKNRLSAAQTKMERFVKHTYPDRKKNIWVREKTKVTDVIEQVRKRKWTWAGHVKAHEITDGHCGSPPGNTMKGKDLEEDRRDGGMIN